MNLPNINISKPVIAGVFLSIGLLMGSYRAVQTIETDCKVMGITRSTGEVINCSIKESK